MDGGANEEHVLHKDVWITVNYNPAVLRGFVFQKEYSITERTNLLILIMQHEYFRFATPEDPALNHDLHPIPFLDYRVFLWEEIDDGMSEFRGVVNVITNTVITDVHRCQTARANLKCKLQLDTNYTHYQVDLRLLINEPLELTNISNIIF